MTQRMMTRAARAAVKPVLAGASAAFAAALLAAATIPASAGAADTDQPKTMLARMAKQRANMQMQAPLNGAPQSRPGAAAAKPAEGGGAEAGKAGAHADGVVLHKGSRSYHRPGCQWYDVNKEVITLEEARQQGIPPCGLCNVQ